MNVMMISFAFVAMLGMMLVGMPIAVSMAVVGIVGGIAAYGVPFMDSIAPVVWGVQNESPADLHPAVRAAGRIAAALGHCRPHVHRAVGLAGTAARRPAAHQHRQLRAVRGHLGFVGRDGGDRRHGGAALAAKARLPDARFAGLAGGRRHAGHPDPAEREHDRVRLAHQQLDRQAVHRRHHPRPVAHGLLHAVDRDLQPGQRQRHARAEGAAARAHALAGAPGSRRWWCSAS